MNKVKTIALTLALMTGVAAFASPAYVGASPASEIQKGVNTTTDAGPKKTLPETIKTVVNTMLYVLGALAVVMIIVGGIRYTTSNGDSAKVKGAKDTLTYSIVGLVIALFAFAIVNFVISSLGS